MLKIKFSHYYQKLIGREHYIANLCYAGPIRIDENTPKRLLWYDTMYTDPKTCKHEFYELKPGDYVLLLFVDSKGIFTTIRPRKGRYGDKLEYYSAHIGEEFEIVIKEDAE